MQTAPTALNITGYSCLWLWVFCLMTLQESEALEAILLQQWSLIWVGEIRGGHCCGRCLVRRSCDLGPCGPCFSSLMTLWRPRDPETEPLEAAGRCQGKEGVGGKFQCSMFSVKVACLFRITLISLPFHTDSWVIARFLSQLPTHRKTVLCWFLGCIFMCLAAVLKSCEFFNHFLILRFCKTFW